MSTNENTFIFHTFGRCVPTPDWFISSARRVNRLYYIHSGEAFVRLSATEEYSLTAGNWYLFPERFDFHIRHTRENPVNHTYFDFTLVPGLLSDEILPLSTQNTPMLSSVLQSISCFAETYSITQCSGAQFRILSSLFSILFQLLAEQMPLTRIQESRIAAALNYIHAHSEAIISVQKLAALTHTEENHFIRLFRRTMSVTPYQYWKDYRLNRAFYELQNGTPIAEAALHAGYANTAAFSKAFHLFFGYPPSDALR